MLKKYLSLVKFSHTIFALPFALLSFFIATRYVGFIDWKVFGLILLCMVFARNAAMAFNRYLDRHIDKLNPRTATREIPAGVINPKQALSFVLMNCLSFILTTWFINWSCFLLSPIALGVILGYSYTKRFTPFCHFVLGVGLALAPVGAYLAAGGGFALIPLLYGIIVMLWVSGFDILYSLQDEQFDRSLNLHSIPEAIGRRPAMTLSKALHLLCAILLIFNSILLQATFSEYQILHWIGTSIFISLLFYQHTLIKPHDLSRINLAFFTTNGMASLIFGSFIILDTFI